MLWWFSTAITLRDPAITTETTTPLQESSRATPVLPTVVMMLLHVGALNLALEDQLGLAQRKLLRCMPWPVHPGENARPERADTDRKGRRFALSRATCRVHFSYAASGKPRTGLSAGNRSQIDDRVGGIEGPEISWCRRAVTNAGNRKVDEDQGCGLRAL